MTNATGQRLDANDAGIIEKAGRMSWFHSIDFRPELDFVSKSRFAAHNPPNYTLYGYYDLLNHIDVKCADCLDIGTMDGIASWILAAKGAGRLTATDIAPRSGFELAKQAFDVDIDYRTDVDLYNIRDTFGDHRFDLVLMCGILYHVFDPLWAISTLRDLVRLNGLAVVETHYLPNRSEPVMEFNPASQSIPKAPNFFWRASESCLEGMFALCCFEVVAKVIVRKRITYLVRAVKPADQKVNPLTDQIQKNFMKMKHYRENIDFNRIVSETDKAQDRLISQPEFSKRLGFDYVPQVPRQPKWTQPPVQQRIKRMARRVVKRFT